LKKYFLSYNFERVVSKDSDTASIFRKASEDTKENVYKNYDPGTLTLSSLSSHTVAISAENKTVWMKCYSHVHNRNYYYNSITHESTWECPNQVQHFDEKFNSRIFFVLT